jgi:molecular chaperone GrpE
MIMDNKENEAELDIDLEPTGDDHAVEPELEDSEATSSNKLKDLRAKLRACETEKMDILEQSQRAKADFLNARKRLEEDKIRDRERMVEKHIEELIPLYDSFAMAMSNKAAWEAIDKNWRIGVEGIFTQLQGLFASYGVAIDAPLGKPFDPQQHEALGNQPVTTEAEHDQIIAVIQAGFVRTSAAGTTTIRPARVIVGMFTN